MMSEVEYCVRRMERAAARKALKEEFERVRRVA